MANKSYIYADNAATTALSERALAAMMPFLRTEYGNASQPYSFSRPVRLAIKQARETIANCIGAHPDEIYFTSCGTESNNWVIFSAVRLGLPIATSVVEHHAILKPCQRAKSQGHNVIFLPVNSHGRVLKDVFTQVISNGNGLASIMYANNEIGTIQPIKELAQLAHDNDWLFHTDAVQALGHMPIDVRELQVDFLSASAHKFNGPKGIGFLYIKRGTKCPSFILGGAQENGLRAGTENVAAIVGMATALQENISLLNETSNHLVKLENQLISILEHQGISYQRNGDSKHISGNISLSFPDFSGETLLHRLDLMGISVSTGSACDSKETQVSHVLKAIGLDEDMAKGTIRISLGRYNTENDISQIACALEKIIKP